MEPIYLLIIPLAQIILGLLVFARNPRNTQHWSFGLLTLSIAVWGITIFTQPYFPLELQTYIARGAFASASLIASSLLIFTLSLDQKKENVSLTVGFMIIGMAVATLSLTPSVIKYDYIYSFQKEVGEYGWAHPVFSGYFLSFIFLALFLLIEKFRKSSGIQRYKIGYILLGTFLSTIIGTTTNLLLPLMSRNPITIGAVVSMIGPSGSIFFTLFSAYAILKYRFFDIRVVIRKGLVYGILLSVLFGFASFFVILLANAITNSFALNVYVSAAIIAAVLAVLFYPLRRGARGIVDVFLARRVPTDMRSTVTNAIVQDVIGQAQTILENVVEAQPIKMILVQDEHTLNWPDRARTHLREYLAATKKALLLQEIPYARVNCTRDAGKALDMLEREMFERDIAVIVPMMTMESGLMGYIVLPPKTDGTVFTADKIYYLERFANAIAFRIEGEIREANQTSLRKI